MEITIKKRFKKDYRGLHPKVKREVDAVIQQIIAAESIQDLPHLKVVHGAENAFRIRVGQYRIGIYIVDAIVTLDSVGARGDFYNSFP